MCELVAAEHPSPLPERLRLSERLPELMTVPGDWFVYSCPWCNLDVVDANAMAVAIMERHLDRHIAAGDHQVVALRVVA